MHDIDRTQLEAEIESSEYPGEWGSGSQEIYGEYEEPYGELYESPFGEMDGEFEGFDTEENTEGPFNEMDEMELASELLSVGSEQELDQFPGKVFKKIGKGIKAFARPLGGVLKSIAKKPCRSWVEPWVHSSPSPGSARLSGRHCACFH